MIKGTVGPRPQRASVRSVITPRRLLQVAAGTATLTLGAWAISALIPADQGGDPAQIASLTPVAALPSSLARQMAQDAPEPQVWLSALAGLDPAPFAAPGYTHEPVLPRAARALPRQPAPPQPPVTGAATGAATGVALPADPPVDTDPEDLATDPAPAVEGIAAVVPDAVAADAPVVPDPDVAVASLHAPRRSLIPQARPQAVVAAAARIETAALDADPEADRPAGTAMALGLIRSRTPQRRPETVARLASLSIDTPPAPVIATPQPEPLRVEPLSRAVAGADRCDSALGRSIPRRPRSAGGGSSVIGQLASASGSGRDGVVISEVMAGNIPDFLRDLVPVTFTGQGPGGQQTRVTICVMPDYLAVGSDRDFVRVPLGLPAAMRVAERFDMVLPTTLMVDAIYAQAAVRLSPSPMEPGPQMSSTNYFLRHNATVERQRQEADNRLGLLVSGHKKDLVLTNRLDRNPGRVAIYGWHRRSGSPIQPLSTVHGAQYADYSHGVRLISRRAFVNGRAVDLRDLLADSRLAGLVSAEGTISNRQLLAALQ